MKLKELLIEIKVISISQKVCRKCCIPKDFTQFSYNSKNKDKMQVYCKLCTSLVFKQWAKANKQYLKEKQRGKKQPYTDRAKKWHHENYKKNKESILARNKLWAAHNPDKVRKLSLMGTNRRKVKELNVCGSHTEEEWNILREHCNYKCVCCYIDTPLTKDHIIPLSKGGTDYIENIQPLCGKCNSSKKDKAINYLLDNNPSHVNFV